MKQNNRKLTLKQKDNLLLSIIARKFLPIGLSKNIRIFKKVFKSITTN